MDDEDPPGLEELVLTLEFVRLKERYAGIFKPELGTVKGVTAKLHLKDNVKPVFQKACPVPRAFRPAVDNELKKMEDEGIID